jgi:hypothetical protein
MYAGYFVSPTIEFYAYHPNDAVQKTSVNAKLTGESGGN